jgi:hypothetical protein
LKLTDALLQPEIDELPSLKFTVPPIAGGGVPVVGAMVAVKVTEPSTVDGDPEVASVVVVVTVLVTCDTVFDVLLV